MFNNFKNKMNEFSKQDLFEIIENNKMKNFLLEVEEEIMTTNINCFNFLESINFFDKKEKYNETNIFEYSKKEIICLLFNIQKNIEIEITNCNDITFLKNFNLFIVKTLKLHQFNYYNDNDETIKYNSFLMSLRLKLNTKIVELTKNELKQEII